MNIGFYFLGQSTSLKKLANKLVYDPFDRYKALFKNENSNRYYSFLHKMITTLNFPKNEKELGLNVLALWFFSRNMELYIGSGIILGTFLTSLFFTELFMYKSKLKIFRNENMNPYIYCFTFSLPLLFNFSPIFAFPMLRVLSWGFFLAFVLNDFVGLREYETWPIFLTAFAVSLVIKKRL